MFLTLKSHPSTPSSAATGIKVDAWRRAPSLLSLRYIVEGDIQRIKMPETRRSAPANDLWKHTCFEAFVGFGEASGYLEFNVSPSSEWAAYEFDGYREGMEPIPYESMAIGQWFGRDSYVLQTYLELDIFGLAPAVPWRIGLSAIIETVDGEKSYWALEHPLPKPDFHHPAAFAHQLEVLKTP